MPPIVVPPPTSASLTPLSILEGDVDRPLNKQNPSKAAGPDSVSLSTLKHYTDQMPPVFTDILNTSLETGHVLACFKTSTIIPVLKKTKITAFNDYRLDARTAVVMKSFERLVLL